MLDELYVENANGQLEFNFEALELITNAKFVEQVRFITTLQGMKIVEVEKRKLVVTVLITNGSSLYKYEYFPTLDMIEVFRTSWSDAKKHYELMEGILNDKN